MRAYIVVQYYCFLRLYATFGWDSRFEAYFSMKLKKFRVYNYKSIQDSGWCYLSGDNITILAGQNESGKTSILEALRDFDMGNDISSTVKPDDYPNNLPEII